MASVTTSEVIKPSARTDQMPLTLIEERGLVVRLGEELARACSDLARDPRGFLRDLFSADSKDRKRRARIYLGLTLALLAHGMLLAVIVYAGWHRFLDRPADAGEYEIIALKPTDFRKPTDAPETPKNDTARGDNGGGGGGGQKADRPATHGVLPQALPQEQIVKLNAPAKPNPALPVLPTIVGPATAAPPADATIGVPTGALGEPPSPGTGDGGGLGEGKGTGVGSGKDGGAGPGSGGGPGTGRAAGTPDGTLTNIPDAVDFNKLRSFPASSNISWIYRARPVVTPEAQANKVIGTVQLRATFRSDGTISDIEVVNGVEFMTESAVESLRRSKFRPATINGVPVTLRRVPVTINVHY